MQRTVPLAAYAGDKVMRVRTVRRVEFALVLNTNVKSVQYHAQNAPKQDTAFKIVRSATFVKSLDTSRIPVTMFVVTVPKKDTKIGSAKLLANCVKNMDIILLIARLSQSSRMFRPRSSG
jgi:hypothetical protein